MFQVLFQVFEELRLVPRIQEIASVPGHDLASKFAAKILTMIGEHVPYKLSQTAPLWSTKDVQYWVRKVETPLRGLVEIPRHLPF